MKKVYILVLFGLIAISGVFAQTNQKVAAEAETFLQTQQDKSAANHQFLDDNVLANQENRLKQDEYRKQFNDINGRIYVLKNQITVAMKSRTPDMQSISTKRKQLENQVEQHDKLLDEYKQWVASLK